MTEEVPVASGMPECNGSVAPEKGPLQVIGVIDEIAKSVGTVPYTNAETSPDAPPAEGNQEENRNSLAEDTACGGSDGEKQCEEKQEANDGTLQQGSADLQDTGTDGRESEEGPGSQGPSVGSGDLGNTAETPAASADGTGVSAAEEEDEEAEEEEEEEEEEEDTEEDEVQVIEIKKENSEVSCLKQQDGGKGASALASPGCNAQVEKPGEQPSPGKKNDISRHSYSRYNTISYRRIRKGNTKQRIDEFESMMHL
ncbi:ermin [Athene cunicularia]|uniref:Ermin n=1 Tax=Athene cunicularia TaxID=194338 RepID=A0A663LKE8_ATHCN|nr:ermin [Athene cunicularia]